MIWSSNILQTHSLKIWHLSSLHRSNTEPRCVKIRYDFVARNPNELTVQKGEVLEVWMRLKEEERSGGNMKKTEYGL